ncbi:MAG: DMT family transporter [Chryseolinea sp.]
MSQKQFESDRLFLIGMILSMTCWGFSWTSGKILASYGSPLAVSALRFSLTFISLVFILPLLKTKLSIARSGLFDLFGAAIMISIYTFLFFKGLVTGKAGAGGVLVTVLNPIISYSIMLVMSRRRPTRAEALGLLLGLAAGIILLKLLFEPANVLNAGNVYFLFASFSWAILSVFTSRASRYGQPLTFSFYMYGISTIIMLVAAGLDNLNGVLDNSDLSFWLNLFFSATITTSLATTFYFVATSKIGASRASSFIFLVPISAALGSWFFLGEIPQSHTIIGGLLGIAAVYVLNQRSAKTTDKKLS